MNYKQKLVYMALGAAILALGITIGQVITPDIEAQSNGVFDEIECRRLVVIDEQGKDAIALATTKEEGNGIIIFHPEGKQGLVFRSSDDASNITAHNPQGQAVAILAAAEKLSALQLMYDDGEGAVSFAALGSIGSILTVSGKESEAKIQLQSNNIIGTNIEIKDSAGNKKWVAP